MNKIWSCSYMKCEISLSKMCIYLGNRMHAFVKIMKRIYLKCCVIWVGFIVKV